MPGVSEKNVPAVGVFRGVICHAACENHEFYGGLVILFPMFSDVFPVFGLRAKKFRAGFFRVSAVFYADFYADPVCIFAFPLLHDACMCARTYARAKYIM